MNMVNWGRIGLGLATGGMSEAGGLRSVADAAGFNPMSDPGAAQEKERRKLLYQQAASSGQFADQGQQNFGQLGAAGNANIAGLQQLANGQGSIAAEQLRQGLQQNQAAQQSMAAGASPQNAAMAARTAAIQSARLGAGLAGQQAIAGLQERAQAQGQLAGAIQGLRGQDLNAALQGRQNAIAGYGGYVTPMSPEKSWLEKYGPAIQSGASAAALLSDRRAKKNIRDGSVDAARALKGLKAFSYEYKDEGNGKGRRVGVMAQDLEKAGLKHTVIDTPGGKMVHGGHLATAVAAMMPVVAKRLDKLERARK
ncbi:MAG TPA: tail fiber domain-containing protein [Microbacterium sp.]|nr:tail fiber domain-containing protein [Microbacterium sp.]